METDSLAAQPSAFLSHASEDKADFAEPLARSLAELGIRPWLDKWEIKPGDSLIQKLFDEGLATVKAVIVVVSESSAAKPWVREELDAAMVARITNTTRLIPIRLDHADMPPPLRHLVWINADRTPAGVKEAGRQIADTLHGRNMRPTVAAPPAYTAAPAVPGLTPADTTLLITVAEEAISSDFLLGLSWQRVSAGAEAKGLAGDVASESLAALVQRGYVKVSYAGGIPHSIELTSLGFSRCTDALVPDAAQVRQKIILSLVNNPPTSASVVHYFAEATGTSRLFVSEFLKRLDRQGFLGFSVTMGGFSRVHSISPTLRRLIED